VIEQPPDAVLGHAGHAAERRISPAQRVVTPRIELVPSMVTMNVTSMLSIGDNSRDTRE
jgi:hypothetical protein